MRKIKVKQWLSCVLAICVVASTTTGAFAAEENANNEAVGFAGGTGSASEPFLINNEEQFDWFAQQVNNGKDYSGASIALNDNITLSQEWTPIGLSGKMFSGTFDGKGYTVSGMTVDSGASTLANIGLFGYIGSTAVLRNVHLSGVSIKAKSETGSVTAGALVGTVANGTASQGAVLDHCTAEGSISFTASNKKNGNIGGLVGLLNQYSVLANSNAEMQLELAQIGDDAAVNAGGLIGFAGINNAAVNCAATGDVTAEETMGKAVVGGLAGIPATVTYNCYASGAVDGKSTVIGGIGGKLSGHTVLRTAYLEGKNAFADSSAGEIDSNTVGSRTADEFSSDDFAKWMNDGLAPQALGAAKVKSPLLASLLSHVDCFYGWEEETSGPAITDTPWSSGEVNPTLFAGGTGTKQDPYQIETEAQLRDFAASLSDDLTYANQYISLQKDISLENGDWVPAGKGEYAFSGIFDGRGHTVSGLNIGSSQSPKQDDGSICYFGLFSFLEGAAVKNLSIKTALYVNGAAGIFTASLAGYASGSTVDGVFVSGTIYGTSGNSEEGTKWKSNQASGGLIGRQDDCVIVNCGSTASVYAGSRGGIAEAGGLVGLSVRGLIANSYATGEISGKSLRQNTAGREYEGMPALGGIVGVNGGTVAQCYASGNLRADVYSYYVGEITGWLTGIGKVYNSYYNTEASQKIADKVISPIQHIGTMVSSGTEEGTSYSGGVDYHNTGLTKQELASGSFADKLNAGFSAFPVNLSDWGNPALLKWKAGDPSVSPTGDKASVTYVAPEIDNSQNSAQLTDGTFLGRSADKTLIVSVLIQGGKIASAKAGNNPSGYALDALLTLVVQANGTSSLTGSDAATVAMKIAVETALKKSAANDITGYGAVNPSAFSGGTGTQSNPYQISTEQQLRAFAAAVNVDESFSGKCIRLTNNINLTQDWLPAGGTAPYAFKGTFDGNGKVISGLRMGTESAPVSNRMSGLFSYLESASVKDLTLKGLSIYTNYSGTQRSYYGALASAIGAQGKSPCYITNVSVSGVIHVSIGNEMGYAGGIAGLMETSVVANCSGNLDIRVGSPQSKNVYAGILIGAVARSAIVNNIAHGSIWAQSSMNKTTIGGITGLHAGVSFNNVADVSLISENPTSDVGGVMGRSTGIAEMMADYYSANAQQQQGSTVNSPNAAVGVVVPGTSAGFGKVSGQEACSEETALTEKLNSNLGNSSYLAETRALLKLWKVSIPSSIRLYYWKTDGTSLAFNTAASVSLAEVSQSDDSSSHSSHSPFKQSSVTKPDSSEPAQVLKAALERAVGGASKSVAAEVTENAERATVLAKDLAGQRVYVYRMVNGSLQLQSKDALTVSQDGTAEILSAQAGSYVLIPASEKPPVSDRAGTVQAAPGGTVLFRIESGIETDSTFTAGNGAVFQTRILQKYNNGSADYGVYVTGTPGEKTGIYVNGVKLFEVKITPASYRSDTTGNMTDKTSGQTYWFKIMPGSDAKAVDYSVGNGQALLTLTKGKQKDGSFLFGFKIIGKSGTQSGIYMKIDGISYCVFHVKVG